MSQINVDTIRNQGGSGAKVQMLASGDVNINDNKLFVDNATSKVGINTNDPRAVLEVEGNGGVILKTSPLIEKFNNVSGASNANATINTYNGAVTLFTTANTNNWTPNITYNDGGSVTSLNAYMENSEVIVVTLISQNGGGSGYVPGNINVDSSSRTTEWSGGSAPTARGGTGGYDVYSFSVMKTGDNAFVVLGQQTHYN
tara:strand:- start:5067 stop:5666 length:600 start_codon:yes stop_codon:yes gene_type:complete